MTTAFKLVILAAGYGTRLTKDIEDDKSGVFAHLVGVPKPLLPIGGIPLCSHWLEAIKGSPLVDGVCVVTNAYNHHMFEAWAKEWPQVQLVCDGSTSNDNRPGAVAAMHLASQHFGATHPLIVVGGDTLFFEDFDLTHVLSTYATYGATCEPHHTPSVVLTHVIDDAGTLKSGILETDSDNRVTAFLEKPGPSGTTSRKACPCFYVLSVSAQRLLQAFLTDHASLPLAARDAPGNFIRYLQSKEPVFAYNISGRFDVGGLASYIECDQYFVTKKSHASM